MCRRLLPFVVLLFAVALRAQQPQKRPFDQQLQSTITYRNGNQTDAVAVLTYASAEHVISEGLITCDDPKLAQVLRSYADATRVTTFAGGSIRVSISQNYPSPPKTITITIPIVRDDLDLARSQVPAGLHVAAWKR